MKSLAVTRHLVFALALGVIAPGVAAQDGASISGTVRDANDALLPGVTFTAVEIDGDTRRTTISDADGRYELSGLEPGRYRVTASLPGFREAETDVDLAEGESATWDVSLGFAFYENITVTPLKREQEILEVPMAITAVTGESIEEAGVTRLQDISATVPGLSMIDTGPGFQRIQIRGISSPLNLPTVGLYLDEMPINIDGAGAALDVRMLDLERVEVLRGPQGTLYGEGSMGGTIKYVTRDPQLGDFGLDFDSAWGTTKDGSDGYRANVVVDIPVVENTFGFRLLAAGEHAAGWVDYPAIGEEDVNEGDSSTFRLKTLWIATDRLVMSLMLQAHDSDFDGQPYMDEDGTAPYILDQPISEQSTLANFVLTYDFGSFSLLSSTGWMDRENEATFDFSTLFVPIFELIGFPPGTVTNSALLSSGELDVLTQEVRLASNGGDRLDWTVGVYYRDYDSANSSYSVSEGNPLPYDVQDLYTEIRSKQFSIFGSLEYAFSDLISATVGARYFSDDREQSGYSGSFGPPMPEPDRSETFTSVDPRFVLSFTPSDETLIYASAAKGFRSGGFNVLVPDCGLPSDYEPEDMWTYEAGTSASFSEGRVVVQGAVYYNDWSDIQTLSLCTGGLPIRQTTNTGKASGPGIDVQLTLSPTRSLRLSLAGNYNDMTYDFDGLNNVEGDRVDYVAEYTLGLAADWSFNWTERNPGFLHLDYQLTGPYTLNFRLFGIEPLESDDVGLFNARLTFNIGALELSVWGQNLLDEDGVIQPAIPFGGLLSAVRPRPRTIGVGLGFHL